MEFGECQTAKDVNAVCDSFYVQLKALNDQKAIDDTQSMFNSIRGAAAMYDVKVGQARRGRIWFVKDEHDNVTGLMRLTDEGAMFHLENLVGIPRAGGGAALLQLAKAVSMSLDKPLKLEAADRALIKYYTDRCFDPDGKGGSVPGFTALGFF